MRVTVILVAKVTLESNQVAAPREIRNFGAWVKKGAVFFFQTGHFPWRIGSGRLEGAPP
jgi:hypothetical protein